MTHVTQKIIQTGFIFCYFYSFISLAGDNKVVTDKSYKNDWDVSGYVKLLADVPTDKRNKKIELDDLSVFISGNVNKWFNPFVEAEYFAGTIWENKSNKNLSDGKFVFERLYNDFKLNNNDNIRIGKFLAPVGFWNLIHAAPLVWTINRPVSSTYSYSNYITGMEYGHLIDAISGSRFDIYVQVTDQFNPKPLSDHPRRYSKIVGGSWTFADDLDSRSSLDFQYAEVKGSGSKRFTVSIQKVWYLQLWDIDTQLIYTNITNNNAHISEEDDTATIVKGWDGGGYLQVRYRFSSQWNFYGRSEYFHYAIESRSGRNIIIGSRYRMGNWGNINIEYKQGVGAKKLNDDGISISYNAMFR